jgi:hypothetical protein
MLEFERDSSWPGVNYTTREVYCEQYTPKHTLGQVWPGGMQVWPAGIYRLRRRTLASLSGGRGRWRAAFVGVDPRRCHPIPDCFLDPRYWPGLPGKHFSLHLHKIRYGID